MDFLIFDEEWCENWYQYTKCLWHLILSFSSPPHKFFRWLDTGLNIIHFILTIITTIKYLPTDPWKQKRCIPQLDFSHWGSVLLNRMLAVKCDLPCRADDTVPSIPWQLRYVADLVTTARIRDVRVSPSYFHKHSDQSACSALFLMFKENTLG